MRADAHRLLRFPLGPADVIPLDLEVRLAMRARHFENPLVGFSVPLRDDRGFFVGRRRPEDDLAVGVREGALLRENERITFLGDLHPVHLVGEQHFDRVPAQIARRSSGNDFQRAAAHHRAVRQRVPAVEPADPHQPIQRRRIPEGRIDLVHHDPAGIVVRRHQQHDGRGVIDRDGADRRHQAGGVAAPGRLDHRNAGQQRVAHSVQHAALGLPRPKLARGGAVAA